MMFFGGQRAGRLDYIRKAGGHDTFGVSKGGLDWGGGSRG